MGKITKRVVDGLKPDAAKELMVWDSELRGFGVRVMPRPKGSEAPPVATYLVKYRNAEGRQRKLALGRVGALTPEEARVLARQRLSEVAHGQDPSAARTELRQAMTVAELCDLYQEDARSRVKASTLSADGSRIRRHVKPLLGARAVVGITAQDIAKMQADIAAGRTAADRVGRGGVTTGGKGAASRTVGMFGTILQFAVEKRLIKGNPARGVSRPPDGKRRRFLSPKEIGALGAALEAGWTGGEEAAAACAALRFLVLSGCRKMEGLALKSEWLDGPARCIRYPDTKSGAQIRAVGSQAVAAAQETAGGGWAFPAAGGHKHFVGLPKVLERLCARAGLEGVTLHVLRHTFAATAAEHGFSELTIAGLLGHTVPGVTARYAHVPDRALVAAAEQVSSILAAQLDRRGAEVVRLREAAVG